MEEKKRLKNLFFVMVVLFVVAVVYYFLYINFPKFVIKCLFKEITGFKCPGCGITRMLVNFINFNLLDGFKYNMFLAITLPYVIYVIVYSCYVYVKDKRANKFFNVSCYIYVGMLIVWGIIRNIVGC